MTQGRFSKEEADATREAAQELFNALPKTRQMTFVGHLNDILLFVSAAKNIAPSEADDVGDE